jgi:hypothetical protein
MLGVAACRPNQFIIVPYNPASANRTSQLSITQERRFGIKCESVNRGIFAPEYAYELHVHLIQFKKQFSRFIRTKDVMIV